MQRINFSQKSVEASMLDIADVEYQGTNFVEKLIRCTCVTVCAVTQET
jgi:hypothetical protein